jgi:uncharacterized membrane protein YuzA (DUF378 family)
MNDAFYGFLVFFALVSLIGGANWLATACNNWFNDGVEPDDLLQMQLGLDSNVANIIYVVVFVCTLALFLMVAFPKNLTSAFSGVKKMM